MTDHSNIPAVQSPIPVNKIKLGLNASNALVLVPIQPMRTAVTGVRERTKTARPRTVGFALRERESVWVQNARTRREKMTNNRLVRSACLDAPNPPVR